jgi:bacillithiol biosynthesis deacetylase BshB1
MKVDILAIGVHPDDVELSCSGTILKHIELGYSVGILDLTKGELGTRGNAETRLMEAKKAAEILGVSFRANSEFSDGFFINDETHQRELIKFIRKYKPEIVLANAISDRHPDHGRAAALISESCFYSGLSKIETYFENEKQEAWRPKAVYHYVQDRFIKPDFVVDVSEHVDTKMKAIEAFASQFYNPNSTEPETPISSKEFYALILNRMATLGRDINCAYAEGFTVERTTGVNNLMDLL